VSTADQIEALRGRLIRVDGDPTPFAPDLTHVGSRGTFAGSLFDLNIGELKAWLRNPPERKDGSLMPNLNLTEDEIDALANYLLSLD
jgi:cytochrome c oxidase subunit 2